MFASKNLMFGQQSGGYQISRSVRIRASASAYFNRTLSTPTDSTKFTFSAWVKRGSLSSSQGIFQAGNTNYIQFGSNDTIQLVLSNTTQLTTTPVFRDPSAWGHLVVSYNNAVSPKWNFYYNNLNVGTSTASNTTFNTATAHGIANPPSGGGYFDGYMTEINFIDGQALTPTSFGAFDAVTGVWNPKAYSGTYGTNGFYLKFSDPTSTTTIGYDYSGNSNNWTANNISVTAGTTYDSMVDSPTNYGIDTGVGGEVRGNYVVLNAVDAATAPSDGNLRLVSGNANYGVRSTIQLPSSGKWYAECIFGTTTNSNVGLQFGFATASASLTNGPSTSGKYGIYADTIGYIFSNTTTLTSGLGVISSGTVLQIAYDGATGNAWVGKANVWYNSSGGTTGNPATGANPTFTSLSSVFVYVQGINGTQYFNAGQTAFSYTAPSGFKALCTQNLPTATIDNGANYVAASLYTGTGASLTVSNAVNSISFQPDMVWIKSRSAATDNKLTDSVRGATKAWVSNSTAAETTDSTGLTAFGSSGFTVGASTTYNNSGATYVGWGWKGGGTAVTNTSGTVNSSVSANTTAGFSAVTYTGSASAVTVGHGLGVAPSMVIVKALGTPNGTARPALVYHISIGATKILYLDRTDAATTTSGPWNDTAPTSTVFSLGTEPSTNWASNNYVAYCFAAISGYSAFGSYTGNGSTDGPFVFTNMRPRWLMFKRTDSTNNWIMYDTSRSTYNAAQNFLYPDLANTEGTGVYIDFVSNGFKLRDTNAIFNASGGTYIYAAFAENPFTLARAR